MKIKITVEIYLDSHQPENPEADSLDLAYVCEQVSAISIPMFGIFTTSYIAKDVNKITDII